jgi:hypothetical protein
LRIALSRTTSGPDHTYCSRTVCAQRLGVRPEAADGANTHQMLPQALLIIGTEKKATRGSSVSLSGCLAEAHLDAFYESVT